MLFEIAKRKSLCRSGEVGWEWVCSFHLYDVKMCRANAMSDLENPLKGVFPHWSLMWTN
jgi:hypothetical protein